MSSLDGLFDMPQTSCEFCCATMPQFFTPAEEITSAVAGIVGFMLEHTAGERTERGAAWLDCADWR